MTSRTTIASNETSSQTIFKRGSTSSAATTPSTRTALLRNGDYGIFVALGLKNTIVRNSALGNQTANYLVASGNNPGTTITASTTDEWSNTQ